MRAEPLKKWQLWGMPICDADRTLSEQKLTDLGGVIAAAL